MQLIIDGQTCDVREGQTILDVASENGIDIPALCAHPKFENYGGCLLCCVEVTTDAAGTSHSQPKLVAACTTKADSVGAVRTRSERIDASRRITLTLLRKRLDDDGALADLVNEYGLEEGLASLGSEDEPAPATLPNCILCGLCVRACDRIGKHALIMEGMGGNRRVVKPAYHGQSSCDDCGLCRRVCPTGAADALELEEITPAG